MKWNVFAQMNKVNSQIFTFQLSTYLTKKWATQRQQKVPPLYRPARFRLGPLV
jgi:hypothetical protein